MLKFVNTSAGWPLFSVVVPSFATQPVLIYSWLPPTNCCHLPHVLPIAFSKVDAAQIQHCTAFTLVKKGQVLHKNWNFDHCCLPWLPAYTGIQNEIVTKCWPNLNRDRCGLAYFECLMLPFDTHHFVPDVQGGVFVFVFVLVFLYSFCATRFQTLPVAHQVS